MGSSLGICLHLISPFIVLSTASRSLFLEDLRNTISYKSFSVEQWCK